MTKKNKPIRVNVCWELGRNRKCETMAKKMPTEPDDGLKQTMGLFFGSKL